MKTKYIIFAILLWGMMLNAFASYSQQSINKLHIPETEANVGKKINVSVNLTNEAEITALQFRLQIPQGATLLPSEVTLTDRKTDHVISVKQIDGNNYLFVLYSITNTSVKGNSGALINVPLQTPAGWEENSTHPFVMSEVVLSTKNGENVLSSFESGSIKVLVEPRPDIAVSSVGIVGTSFSPGDKISGSWVVKNVGDKITGAGWTEQVSLVADNGETVFLGNVYYNQLLAPGALVTRQVDFTLPELPGVNGNVKIRVKLVPDANLGEISSAQGNNALTADTYITIGKKLKLELPSGTIPENNPSPVKCVLFRSGSRLSAETFTINADDPSRLNVPASVTIPAGQSGVVFYINAIDNTVLNAIPTVVVTAKGNGYTDITGQVAIEDNEIPSLTIKTSKAELNEGETFKLTIEREVVTSEPLIVCLSCDHPKRFEFPAKVEILANQKSVEVNVTAIDDKLPDVTIDAVFSVTASNHVPAKATVTLYDDDIPEISLTIAPETVTESAGPMAVMAVLKRLTKTDTNITVKLSDNSNGKIYYSSSTLTLAPGVQEARFTIGVVDNALVDGDQEIDITAAVYISSCSCSASGTSAGIVHTKLTVLDDDGPALKVTSSQAMLLEGKTDATILTVSRNTATTQALTVTLSSDHDSELIYNKTVTIPAGQASVDVPVSVKANDITEGDRTVTFTVTSSGYTKGVCWVMITDQTLPDAVISDLKLSAGQVEAAGKIDVSITVANQGVSVLPSQTKVNVYLSNSAIKLLTLYTQKTLAAGESEVITKNITLPDITGNYTLSAVVNEEQTVKELLYINNNSGKAAIRLLPKYMVSVTTDKKIYKPGEAVVINGTATGNGVANAPVDVYIINSGIRQVVKVTTGTDGKFQTTFQPQAYQSGHFVIGACYPDEGLETGQASFDIYGLKRTSSDYVKCETLTDELFTGTIQLSNPGTLKLTNVSTTIVSSPANCNVQFEPIAEIAADGTVDLKYTVTGHAVTEGSDWELIKAHVTTTEGATLDLTIYYYCRSPKGQLQASISSINTTMIKGASRDYSFTIANIGKGETGKISLSLPQNSTWMTAVTPKEMASLKNGESTTVILRLTPTNDMPLNVPVTGSIGINCENGQGLPLSFEIEPVSESKGTLIIDVCDEYTYYTPEAPHLAGAKVVVKHPVTGAVIAQGITNDKGIYTIELPEGYYGIDVSADKHDRYQNNILVDPGKETRKVVNLSFQAITIDWKVEETTVEDEYEIVTTVKYETNVPTPVVEAILPEQIPVEELQANGYYMFNAVLTNKGLITASNVQLNFPEYEALSFEYLGMVNGLNLRPQESVIIPVRVSLKEESQLKSSVSIKSFINLPCKIETYVFYVWDCGNDRKWHQYPVTIKLLTCSFNLNIGDGQPWTYNPPVIPECHPPRFPWDIHIPQYNWPWEWECHPPKLEDTGCIPCQNRIIRTLAMCPISIPVYDCLKSSWDCGKSIASGSMDAWDVSDCVLTTVSCASEICAYAATASVVGAKVGVVCKLVGTITQYVSCLKDILKPCDLNGDEPNLKSTNSSISYIEEFQTKASVGLMQAEAEANIIKEYFGTDEWNNCSTEEFSILMNYLYNQYSKAGYINPNEQNLLNLKPTAISTEEFIKFIDRLNNTTKVSVGEYVEGNNYIHQDVISKEWNDINQSESIAVEMGYSSVKDLMDTEYEKFKNKLEEASSSVCASISLQFSQTMTMTRQAFCGTLSVFNGHESTAMQNVKLNLVVKDELGNIATEHVFQINNESLDKFSGDLNGEWTLNAQETGKATILFIPTKYAALTEPKDYYFGGTLSYLDPFTGLVVTRDLYPVTLTVKPSPNLDLTYFIQRDVLGDDPLTADVIEPMVPAEFSLLIHNIGAGEGTNIKMVTKQPEITVNEKGLLINFELLSSQLNGLDHTLALGESVATDFGNIPAGGTAYAQWWFTSTLLGHFTDYDVKATHVTSYGNPDLTLLDTVTIHELIRSIRIPKENNSFLTGFMANDIPDADDLPDILYLSDGTIENMVVTSTAQLAGNSNNQYTLSVTPLTPGWNYGSINDPTNGHQKLLSIRRVSDNAIIYLHNFWQTDRTLRDGKDPLYENKLHFVDKFGTGAEQYILTFEEKPAVILAVESFTGIPQAGTVASTPVSEVRVRFNKPIDASTFTADDLTLNCQGIKQDASLISITKINDQEFTLNIAQVAQNDGYYVLTVQTAGITDNENFKGEAGEPVVWIQYLDGKVQLTLTVTPENTGNISLSSGKYVYGSVFNLVATPANGYEFVGWNMGGKTLSTEEIYQHTLLNQSAITAAFKAKSYNMTLVYDQAGGSITGGSTGIYEYGKIFNLIAMPVSGYNFSGWKVNNVLMGTNTTLQVTVNSDVNIEAVFTKVPVITEKTVTYNLLTGWNWISVNVADPNLNNLVSMFSPIVNNLETVRSYDSELLNVEDSGLEGSLIKIEPEYAYKIKMNQSGQLKLKGFPFMPDEVNIGLNSGWNWLGYIPDTEMSLNDAFAGLNAEMNDVVKGQDAFAMYNGSEWIGSLKKLAPASGYMYYANQAKSFMYSHIINETPGSSIMSSIWSYDKRKYSDNMNIVARLYSGGDLLDPADYAIGAFVEDECRGTSVEVSGYQFITIHGESSEETVTFKAINISTQEEYLVTESVNFSNSIMGNLNSSLSLHLEYMTGIDNVKVNRVIGIYPNPVKNTARIKYTVDKDVTELMLFIYDVSGKVVDKVSIKSFIPGSNEIEWQRKGLASGMYYYSLEGYGNQRLVFKNTEKFIVE